MGQVLLMSRNSLSIRDLTVSSTPAGGWRIDARAGAGGVFFESSTPLAPAREALLQAFLFPAMCRGRGLETDGPVCPRWRKNTAGARRVAREWWGFRGGGIRCTGDEALAPAPGQSLFFGGGVDSFYTLWTERERLTHLVYVEGYDVPLDDAGRLARIGGWNRAVAAECGLALAVIRTNLRDHPDFKVLSWTNSFGGAVAAAGHLLRGSCGTALLANDGHVTEINPWVLGMHPRLTPCCSSGAVRFVHHGEGVLRCEKAAAIAGWPLARRYLRVCWKNREGGLNCGVCEKCVRTQLEFFAAGQIEALESMPPGPLEDRLDAIPGVPDNLYLYYEDLLERIGEPRIHRAILALGERSVGWRRRRAGRDAAERYWKRVRRSLRS
jgi:hypothetical protein